MAAVRKPSLNSSPGSVTTPQCLPHSWSLSAKCKDVMLQQDHAPDSQACDKHWPATLCRLLLCGVLQQGKQRGQEPVIRNGMRSRERKESSRMLFRSKPVEISLEFSQPHERVGTDKWGPRVRRTKNFKSKEQWDCV